jgi:hypothetical protein
VSEPRLGDAFFGVANDTAPLALPPGYYQTDNGGDRLYRGVWRKRRGLLRTNLDKITSTPVAVLGFRAPGTDFSTGSDFAMLIAAGTHIYGAHTVGEQTF